MINVDKMNRRVTLLRPESPLDEINGCDTTYIASWGCSRSQGYGCSPFKAVRELGSERRETVRSLSIVGGGNLRGAVLSTRGPGWTDRWCISYHANGNAE